MSKAIFDYKVAVITRTKDRPLALRRSLRSLEKQTLKSELHWVVCDDGDVTTAEWVKDEAETVNISCTYMKVSTGGFMEIASNVGINSSKSKYIAIHDDDDTWEPDFLEKTTNFLECNSIFKGVVTYSTQVHERLTASDIQEISRNPYNPGLTAIYLGSMTQFNLFPPISFLFCRDAAASIGFFDEDLPVLGDWDFNLRFLDKYDIGLIPEYLANYHFRSEANSTYGNSVTQGRNLHQQYDAIVRNKFLRSTNHEVSKNIGTLMALNLISGSNSQFIHDYQRIRSIITKRKLISAIAKKLIR